MPRRRKTPKERENSEPLSTQERPSSLSQSVDSQPPPLMEGGGQPPSQPFAGRAPQQPQCGGLISSLAIPIVPVPDLPQATASRSFASPNRLPEGQPALVYGGMTPSFVPRGTPDATARLGLSQDFESQGPSSSSFQQEPGPSTALVAEKMSAPPVSSNNLRFPLRPGKGQTGQKCIVKANLFPVELPDKDLYQYDVTITPAMKSSGVNRAVIRQLVELYKKSSLGQRLPVYDGRKSLYTAGPLPFQTGEFSIKLVDEDDGSGTTRRERVFKVVIKFAARVDLHHLGEFLKGRQVEIPQEVIQVLDIVLKELPTRKFCAVGKSFYSPDFGRRHELGGGLESQRGFYQSIRPTQMGTAVVIDMSSTAFVKALPVVDFVSELLNKDISRHLSRDDWIKMRKALKGVKVEVTHRGNMRRQHRIFGLTLEPTQELMYA